LWTRNCSEGNCAAEIPFLAIDFGCYEIDAMTNRGIAPNISGLADRIASCAFSNVVKTIGMFPLLI
jgi:hypothetical protein